MNATGAAFGVLGIVALAAAGCGGGDGGGGDGTAGSGSGSDGATSGASTVETDTGTGAGSGSGSDSGSLCGNGAVDDGEECDDGNVDDGDGCQADCTDTPGHRLWEVSFDGPSGGVDFGSAIALDTAENILIGGGMLTEDEGRDMFIGKLDADGAEQWTLMVTGPGGGTDHVGAIAGGPNDEVVAAGYVATEVRAGDEPDDLDIWIGSYDGGGNEQWTTTVAGAAAQGDIVRAVTVASDGTIFAVGLIEDTLDDVDMWIGAYADDGTPLWSDTITRTDYDAIGGVAIDGDDNVLVGGHSEDDAGAPLGLWFRLYDRGGNELWTVDHAGEMHPGYINGLALTSDDSIVITGLGRSPAGGWRMVTRRFDPAGAEVWRDDYSKQGPFGAFAVATAPDDTIYVTGLVGLENRSDDIYLGSLDPTGERNWSRFYDGPASLNDIGEDVVVTGDGFPIVIGSETVLGEGSNIWVGKYTP